MGTFAEGNSVGVIPDGKEQLWIKTVEPSSGGYFILENQSTEKVLTAVNASRFQLEGMFLLV